MSVYPASGKWDLLYFRKKASTAFTANNFVAFETNGTAGDPIEPADASDESILGIGLRTITSATSDYGDNSRVPVLVPVGMGAEFECDTVAGTLVVADEGLLQDLTDATTVNRAASSLDVIQCTRFISATRGRFMINRPSLGREETYD